jgi:exonuclease VII large subunit
MRATRNMLTRAGFGVIRRATAMKSLLTLRVRSAETEIHRSFEMSYRTGHSMLRQRKSVVEGQLKLGRHCAHAAIVKAQIARDRLRAMAEGADVHGPLSRGFVMVTDTTGRWLRAASETVPEMKLVFKEGTVRVRKD